MLRGLVTAVRTLTILPVPGREAKALASALPWFPLVGALLGLALYGLGRGVELAMAGWTEGAALAVVAGGVWLTRGLHLDGLADWADGFGGGRDRAHTLEIMKDSCVGAFGVLALVVLLLAKYVALSRLLATGSLGLIVPALVVSRTVLVELAAGLPYARPEGGTAAGFVSGARWSHRLGALLLALLLTLGAAGTAGLALLAGGLVAGRLLGRWFLRRLGGVTGDLLGAGCELVETGLLVAGAAAGPWLLHLWGGRLLP